MYHKVCSLYPYLDANHQFLQIYFLDIQKNMVYSRYIISVHELKGFGKGFKACNLTLTYGQK